MSVEVQAAGTGVSPSSTDETTAGPSLSAVETEAAVVSGIGVDLEETLRLSSCAAEPAIDQDGQQHSATLLAESSGLDDKYFAIGEEAAGAPAVAPVSGGLGARGGFRVRIELSLSSCITFESCVITYSCSAIQQYLVVVDLAM